MVPWDMKKPIDDMSVDDVRDLIDAGADVNHTDHCGITMLTYFAWRYTNCDHGKIKLLIRAGAELKTELFIYAPEYWCKRRKKIIACLIDYQSDVNSREQYIARYGGAINWRFSRINCRYLGNVDKSFGTEEFTKIMIDAGIDLHTPCNDTHTKGNSLKIAVHWKTSANVVKMLIEADF